MTIAAGTRLGRYEIRSKIGEGGMGEVYLAEDTILRRLVAIKFLSADSASDAEANKRLLREAQAAAKLDHPNICSVHECVAQNGRSFIVMPYVEGETLDRRLKQKPLDVSESVTIAVQVADALAEAHTHKVVHRDIKPANIIITPRGQAKVMDFGLAKFAGFAVEAEAETQKLLTTPGMIIGTVPYMSPEQVKGESVDARTDIFSFGVVLYEMLSGRQPFASQSAAETISAILNLDPPALLLYAPNLPSELQRITRKCLEKDRNLRYQNAAEVRNDLQLLKRDTQSRQTAITAERMTTTEADAPPTGDKAVYAFLELFALAFTFEGASALLRGEALWRVVGAWVLAIILFVAGIRWPRIKLRLRQRFGSQMDRPEPGTSANAPSLRAAVAFTRWYLIIPAALVLLVFIAAAYLYYSRALTARTSEIKSLAVLPLNSLDAGDNYLGLGIADAAIRKISQTGKVIVRPTSAVNKYSKGNTDALSAAKELGVDSVLEGSFQHANDRLRVSVNLLRTSDGMSLWSDQYDLRTTDIFTIQDTVAQQVASHLRLQLDSSQQAQLTKRYTSNPIAYEFYLRGAFTFDQRLSSGNPAPQIKSAIDLYKKAIDADPNFALAHAQRAYAYAHLAVFLEPTQPEWVERAKEEANRAQELDPQLAETHLVRFQLLYSEFEGYQGEAAVREVRLANQLNPDVGHSQLAYLYNHLGLEDLAARELERAREVDPTSGAINDATLLMYEVQSKYDEYAANQNVRHEGRSEVWYFIGKGRLYEAQKAFDEWSLNQPNHRELTPTKALLLASKGDFHAAEAEIPIILSQHPLKDPLYHHAAYDIACVYALEGKSAEAVKWLREAAVTGYQLYPRYERDAYLNRIRQAPEFIQFLAEMKALNEKYQREFGGT